MPRSIQNVDPFMEADSSIRQEHRSLFDLEKVGRQAGQTLEGLFLAVSKPIFASKYFFAGLFKF